MQCITKTLNLARLLARIYKWYRDSHRDENSDSEIAKNGEEIKKAIFWNETVTTPLPEGFLENMKKNRDSILKKGWTSEHISAEKKNSFTQNVKYGQDKPIALRNVPPTHWPPEINPLFIKKSLYEVGDLSLRD